MQDSIQEGATLFLYNTGAQKIMGPFKALSGAMATVGHPGGGMGQTRKERGFPSTDGSGKGGQPRAAMEGSRQQAAPCRLAVAFLEQNANGKHAQ